MEKCVRARRATGDNIIRCMHFACGIAKATYTTLRICNNLAFFMATVVTGTLLSVTFVRTWPVLLYIFPKTTKENREENVYLP